MPLQLEKKKELVAEVQDIATKALLCVGAEYAGLTVDKMMALRKEARACGVYLKVMKNTLASRAFAGTAFECLQPALKGSLVLGFSLKEPGAVARLFKDFSKQEEKFKISLIGFGGQLLPVHQLDRLSALPTREKALAQLMGVLQAPIAQFLRTVAEPSAKLVRTFAALHEQKQAA